jgi:hypothetical protein
MRSSRPGTLTPQTGAIGSNNLGNNNLGGNRGSVGNSNLGNGNRGDIGNRNVGNGNRGDIGSNNRRTNVNTGNRNNVAINNPVYGGGGAYGWNGGVAWAPAPYYWGGGFWGAMAIGVTSAAVYGAIVDEDEHVTYNSYQVQANTPGSTFLTSYNLTQVKCGPPNLVVVYGPENSVICANPNDKVAAGEYNLNTETLALTQR